MPFQHEQPNIYIWLCRGKDALFTYILFVETGCTSKLLQGEMLIIDQQNDSTDHDKCVCSGHGFQHTCLLCIHKLYIYIYSCRNVLEVHRYFPVHVEQMLHLFCKLLLSRHRTASLVIGAFFNNDTIRHLVIKELSLEPHLIELYLVSSRLSLFKTLLSTSLNIIYPA